MSRVWLFSKSCWNLDPEIRMFLAGRYDIAKGLAPHLGLLAYPLCVSHIQLDVSDLVIASALLVDVGVGTHLEMLGSYPQISNSPFRLCSAAKHDDEHSCTVSLCPTHPVMLWATT